MAVVNKFDSLPHNIQIELVEGCNRMCQFCGIYGIWQNPKDRIIKKMSFGMAVDIAVDLGSWFGKKRIEFAMHGEPTLHEDLPAILDIFRKECQYAQLQLTTNGMVLLKKGEEFIENLFECGLNILIVDTYTEREKLKEICKKVKNADLEDYYESKFNCYQYHNHKIKKIVLMGDIGEMTGKKAARKIINHAGNINPKFAQKFGVQPVKAPLKKTCSRPFREVTIHNDGSIPLCCIDWKHEFIVGKFPEQGSIKEIWFGEMFNVMRHFLGKKDRRFLPCYHCDYNGGFRLGLLPKLQLDTPEEELLKKVRINYEKTQIFAHKNASPDKFYIKNNGILDFLKKG